MPRFRFNDGRRVVFTAPFEEVTVQKQKEYIQEWCRDPKNRLKVYELAERHFKARFTQYDVYPKFSYDDAFIKEYKQIDAYGLCAPLFVALVVLLRIENKQEIKGWVNLHVSELLPELEQVKPITNNWGYYWPKNDTESRLEAFIRMKGLLIKEKIDMTSGVTDNRRIFMMTDDREVEVKEVTEEQVKIDLTFDCDDTHEVKKKKEAKKRIKKALKNSALRLWIYEKAKALYVGIAPENDQKLYENIKLEMTANGLCAVLVAAGIIYKVIKRKRISGHQDAFIQGLTEFMSCKPEDRELHEFWWNCDDRMIRLEVLDKCITQLKDSIEGTEDWRREFTSGLYVRYKHHNAKMHIIKLEGDLYGVTIEGLNDVGATNQFLTAKQIKNSYGIIL